MSKNMLILVASREDSDALVLKWLYNYGEWRLRCVQNREPTALSSSVVLMEVMCDYMLSWELVALFNFCLQ